MKIIPQFILSLFLGVSISAQMTTYIPSQTFEGTSLGANETLSASGIDIANAVKMRGYVDFIFSYDDQDGGDQNEDYSTASDVDFLLDLSPVTAELHLDLDGDTLLEQAFGRYSFNDAFNVTFGRQLTVLGFEDDEAPGLYAVSNAYLASNDDVNPVGATVRRNYKDGTLSLIHISEPTRQP